MYYGTYSAFYLIVSSDGQQREMFLLFHPVSFLEDKFEFRAYFCHVAPLNITPNNKSRRNSVLFIRSQGQHTFFTNKVKRQIQLYYQRRSDTSCYVLISSEKSTKIRIFEVHKKQQILKYCVLENIFILYLPEYHLRNS